MNDLTSQQIGPYQVTLKIYETPLKTIYRAFDQKLGREVVLVAVLPNHPYPDGLADKIKAHARTLASLKQLSIAPLLDCDVYEDLLCLVFDLIPKSVFRKPLQQTYDWVQAARLLVPVAQALTYAHQNNVLHLALSLPSILISREGSLYLYDFGMDWIIQQQLAQASPGVWNGGAGVRYMAPEQVLQKGIDFRTDIYAFGMLYYELIFGQPRFSQSNLLENLVEQAQPPKLERFERVEKPLPKPVRLLIQRTLSPDREKRFHSMLEVSVLFTRIALGHKLTQGMVRKPLKTVRQPMKSATKRAIAAGCLIIVLAVAGFIFRNPLAAFARAHLPTPAVEVAQTIPTTTPTATFQAVEPANTPRPKQPPRPTSLPTPIVQGVQSLPVLLDTPLPGMDVSLEPKNAVKSMVIARWGFGKVSDMEISPDGRSTALATTLGIYLLDSQGYQMQGYIDAAAEVVCVAYSPDGARLASGDTDGLIRIWNVETGLEVLSLGGHTAAVNDVSFSPDGAFLASASNDDTVRVWGTSDGDLLHTFTDHVQPVRAVAFSPDGSVLLSGGQDYTLKSWNYKAGRLIESRAFSGKINAIKYFPNGQWVALAEENGRAEIFDLTTDISKGSLVGLASPVLSISVNRDGSLIAAADGYGKTMVWNTKKEKVFEAETKQFNHILKTGTIYSHSVQFTQDGKSLVSSNWDNVIESWNTGDWKLTDTFDDASYFVNQMAASWDNQLLAVQRVNNVIDVFDLGQSKRLYQLKGEIISSRAFSYDLRYLALLDSFDTVKVYDARRGTEVYMMGGNARIADAYFSPDGLYLVTGDSADVHIWSMNSGQEIKKKINYANGCSIVYDWREKPLLFVTRFNLIGFYNFKDSAVCQTQRVGWMQDLVLTDEGTMAAAGGASLIQVWDYTKGDNLTLMENTYGLVTQKLAINENASLVAAAIDDQSIRIWDASSGKEIVRLYSHTQPITSLLFTNNAHYLISSSLDGTVHVWGIAK